MNLRYGVTEEARRAGVLLQVRATGNWWQGCSTELPDAPAAASLEQGSSSVSQSPVWLYLVELINSSLPPIVASPLAFSVWFVPGKD